MEHVPSLWPDVLEVNTRTDICATVSGPWQVKRLRAGGGLTKCFGPIGTRLTPSSVNYGNAPRDDS